MVQPNKGINNNEPPQQDGSLEPAVLESGKPSARRVSEHIWEFEDTCAFARHSGWSPRPCRPKRAENPARKSCRKQLLGPEPELHPVDDQSRGLAHTDETMEQNLASAWILAVELKKTLEAAIIASSAPFEESLLCPPKPAVSSSNRRLRGKISRQSVRRKQSVFGGTDALGDTDAQEMKPSLGDGLFVLDGLAAVSECNQAAAELLGFDCCDELVGRGFVGECVCKPWNSVAQALIQALTESAIGVEAYLLKKDSSAVRVFLKIQCIKDRDVNATRVAIIAGVSEMHGHLQNPKVLRKQRKQQSLRFT